MLPWKPVLPTQLLTRGVAAWCPRCLNGWREDGRTIHMPLLWALEVVKYCPDHCCPLQSVYANCGKPQPLLGQRCPLGCCARCKKWLGAEGSVDQGTCYCLLPAESQGGMGCPSSQGHDPCCICLARIAESTTVVASDLGCDRCRGPFQFFSNAGSDPRIRDGLEIRREAADASGLSADCTHAECDAH